MTTCFNQLFSKTSKILVILLAVQAGVSVYGQASIRGIVTDIGDEALIGATVQLKGQKQGTVTDAAGRFFLTANAGDTLVVSYIGYQSDTVPVIVSALMHIRLKENQNELGEVRVKGSSTFIDDRTPMHVEVITENELMKAACCNLSESFETNASVDVSYSDAVTGTKVVRMLGLDGKYVSIGRENMPYVRGLNTRSGLGFIPGTWIQSIDVGKGAGSVVNGYESMTGQINVELKKPENSESLYLNAYSNSFGRYEMNANAAVHLSDNWSTALLLHYNAFTQDMDKNGDGFMDLPKSRQVNVLNRYKWTGDRIHGQIGFNVMKDATAGGQVGFDLGENALVSPIYGYANEVVRGEIFGKLGILYPEAPYKGWGVLYSFSYQRQESAFGHRSYTGENRTLYTNFIHQNIFGTSFHQYKMGGGVLIDTYDESLNDSLNDSIYNRSEVVPGAFFEYTYMPASHLTLVIGDRLDFNGLYGIYHTPRIHVKYQAHDEGVALRLAAGKGYRTANVVTENSQFLVSNRQLMVVRPLEPEESWNFGGSVIQESQFLGRDFTFLADYFYTIFRNQVIADVDTDPSLLLFYNLDGKSYAHSVQAEAALDLTEHIVGRVAYKYYDVKTTIGGRLRPLPFISRQRVFANLAYASHYDIWKLDLTAQWYGAQRLPDTSEKEPDFQRGKSTPDFVVINTQVSREFRWGQVYLGAENLLDFRQSNPIIDPENPFGNNFDASFAWAPIAGRMVYLGVRFKVK